MRRRIRREHQGAGEPRAGPAGAADPAEPGSPRRRRRRRAVRRRRRNPDPDPRRLLPGRTGEAGSHAAAARRVRGRDDLPAAGTRVAAGVRTGTRAHGPRGRPGGARLARRPDRPRDADVAAREGSRARHPPDLHRPRTGRDGAGRARAQALRDPQDRQPQDPGAEAEARQGVLRAVDLDAHRGLQGPAARRPGRPLLHGPRRSARRVGDRAGAPALLDQHVPGVGTRAPVPPDRAQRRDQHGEGQLQLDTRARGRDVVAGAA